MCEELPQEIIQLYLNANSPDNLFEALSKSDTISYAMFDNNLLIGIVIARVNHYPDGFADLQIRRLHTSRYLSGFKGIGRALLTVCAVVAQSVNIQTLMTTASMPARGFFEALRWQGEVIFTKYHIRPNFPVNLAQYKCSFTIPANFEGF